MLQQLKRLTIDALQIRPLKQSEIKFTEDGHTVFPDMPGAHIGELLDISRGLDTTARLSIETIGNAMRIAGLQKAELPHGDTIEVRTRTPGHAVNGGAIKQAAQTYDGRDEKDKETEKLIEKIMADAPGLVESVICRHYQQEKPRGGGSIGYVYRQYN